MCTVESNNTITLHLKFENCSYKLLSFLLYRLGAVEF
jgi:hypothetical protein